jgi:hypothetical protein
LDADVRPLRFGRSWTRSLRVARTALGTQQSERAVHKKAISRNGPVWRYRTLSIGLKDTTRTMRIEPVSTVPASASRSDETSRRRVRASRATHARVRPVATAPGRRNGHSRAYRSAYQASPSWTAWIDSQRWARRESDVTFGSVVSDRDVARWNNSGCSQSATRRPVLGTAWMALAAASPSEGDLQGPCDRQATRPGSVVGRPRRSGASRFEELC